MEVQSKVDKSLANCVGAECDADYKSAFVLYKEAFDIDCANYKVFDVEQRVPLRDYRMGLKALILAREEKLKALEKQAAELRASLADPGTTLAELFPLIDKHIKIQDVACKKMPVNTEKVLKELKAMQSDVTSGKFSCEIEGGETPISATGTESGSVAQVDQANPAAQVDQANPAAQVDQANPAAQVDQQDQVNPAAQVDQKDQAARLMRVVLATQVHLVDQVIKLLDLETLLKKFLMEMRNQREDDLGEVLKMQVVDADSKCRFNESYDGSASKNICNS